MYSKVDKGGTYLLTLTSKVTLHPQGLELLYFLF